MEDEIGRAAKWPIAAVTAAVGRCVGNDCLDQLRPTEALATVRRARKSETADALRALIIECSKRHIDVAVMFDCDIAALHRPHVLTP